jgi:O-antigen/teichoic acid export membrane protein
MRLINKSAILFVDSFVNLFYSLAVHFLLLFILRPSDYALFTIGLTLTSIYSVLSLGIPQLAPSLFMLRTEWSKKLKILIFEQFKLVFALSAFAFLILMASLYYGFNLQYNYSYFIIASSLLFLSIQFDEIVHIYFRCSENEGTSLLYSCASKIIILSSTIISSLLINSGLLVFLVYSTVYFVVTLCKLSKVVNYFEDIRDLISPIRFSELYLQKDLWLGNVSDMLFNGISRLVVGAAYGEIYVAVLSLSNQMGSASSRLIAAVTLRQNIRKIGANQCVADGLHCFNLFKLSVVIFIVTAITIFLVNFYFFCIKTVAIPLDNKFWLTLIPISLTYALFSFSSTYYQICQLTGTINFIAISNFRITLVGSVLMYSLYLLNLNSLVAIVNFLVVITSVIVIYNKATSLVPNNISLKA